MSFPGGDVASMFGGAHHDVMSAAPEDAESKIALVTELKNRGRAAIAAKNYLEAEMLYGKGLEVTADAVLHGNRAAARIGLHKYTDALADADAAISLDPSYSKAHYRRGQALMALSRPAEAVTAFEAGLAFEPESKAFITSIAKAKTAVAAAAAAGGGEAMDMWDIPAPAPAPVTAAPARAPAASGATQPPAKPASSEKKAAEDGRAAAAAAAATAAAAAKKEEKELEADDGGAASAEAFRGYRRREDGRVTTYFNRDLSDEAKALLGDIAPKKIVATEAAAPAGVASSPSQANGGAAAATSVWNAAGTWEERDVSRQCKDRIETLLAAARAETPSGVAEVTEIKDFKGDASITFSRGKKRYLFDFAFDLEWEAELECGKAKGKLHYPDVSYDSMGEYEAHLTVDATTPPEARHFIDRFVRSGSEGLQPVVRDALNAFVEEFQAEKL